MPHKAENSYQLSIEIAKIEYQRLVDDGSTSR
jgi:hypothetical protein